MKKKFLYGVVSLEIGVLVLLLAFTYFENPLFFESNVYTPISSGVVYGNFTGLVMFKSIYLYVYDGENVFRLPMLDSNYGENSSVFTGLETDDYVQCEGIKNNEFLYCFYLTKLSSKPTYSFPEPESISLPLDPSNSGKYVFLRNQVLNSTSLLQNSTTIVLRFEQFNAYYMKDDFVFEPEDGSSYDLEGMVIVFSDVPWIRIFGITSS
jgi:hypothetical protein